MVVLSNRRLTDFVYQPYQPSTFLIVKTVKCACAVPTNEKTMALDLSIYFWEIPQEVDNLIEKSILKCLKLVIQNHPVTYLKYKALTMTKGTKK